LCRFRCGFNIIGKQSPSDLPADFDVAHIGVPGVTGVTAANGVEISAGVSGVSVNGVEGADEDSEWVPTALKPPARSAKWVPTA